MKMNKILAAGVAASLAVTSLAAVASAAERTFEMKYTEGKVTYTAKTNKNVSVSLDDKFGYKKLDNTGAVVPGSGSYDPTKVQFADADTNNDGAKDYRDWDAVIPVMIDGNDELVSQLGALQVVVNGRKLDNGNLVAITQTATIERMDVYAADGTTPLGNYILPIYFEIAPQGAFLANDFVAVDSIQIVNASAKDIARDGMGKKTYQTITGEKGAYYLTAADATDKKVTYTTTKGEGVAATANIYVEAASAYQLKAATTVTKVNGVNTMKLTNGETAIVNGVNPADRSAALFDKIIELIGDEDSAIVYKWSNDSWETYDSEAWLPITDGYVPTTIVGNFVYNKDFDNGTIERQEVHALSVTGDWASGSDVNASDWGNQTYDEKDYNEGTMPKGFSGLASQVADFFNKQLNGTITFHFTAGKAAAGDSWLAGGIPSTEVGIKNAITGMTKNDIALFINYASTTGSLQAATEVKAEELSVTFDITDILDALNGQTIGTVQDIYYGMVKGVEYDGKNVEGFKVDKVVLAYEEEAEEEDVIDEEEETEEVEEEETEEVEEVEEEEEETEEVEEVEEEEEEETEDVGGDMFEEEEETEEDSNPGTGVALAVVPAIMAAAAVVVSKKRK